MAMRSTLEIVRTASYVAGQLQDTDLAAQQIVEGFRRDSWPVSGIDEALGHTDDGARFYRITHTPSAAVYTQVKMYFGDTEVGYLYVEGTLNMVAYISDGDLRDCQVFEAVDDVLPPPSMSTQTYCFPR